MTDPLFDDVKALLDKDFGDDRILKQIARACENNEVISNYERNYVKKLAEKHLGRQPKVEPTPVEEKPSIPDVVIPQSTQTMSPQQPKISYSNPNKSKILLGVGGLALAVIVIIAVSFSGISDVTPTVNNSEEPVSDSLMIKTDFSSYNKKDIISINGISDTSGSVNLSITNQNNELVWTEQVSLKSDGRYSTLAIAGGPGWENSGTYTIKVDNGKETTSDTFSFTA